MAQLSRDTLGRVPSASRPLIVPGDITPGIVHLGVGAFHRAHQAVYSAAAITSGGGDWAIIGVALRRRELVDTLIAQDGLITATTLTSDPRTSVIGSICDTRHGPSDPQAVVALLADPAIRIVTHTTGAMPSAQTATQSRLSCPTCRRYSPPASPTTQNYGNRSHPGTAPSPATEWPML